MEDIKSTVASRIASLRAQHGMTQLELAEKLHYSDKAVSKWERGESIPEVATLVAIAELFEVSLDELILGKRPAVTDSPAANDKKMRNNHAIITAMSILLAWFVASLVFVIFDLVAPESGRHWLSFIYAIPASAIVWLVFNTIWFNRRHNFAIISLLAWSILAALHISFAAFSVNIWQVYLLGIPGQVAIFLWSGLKKRKSHKPQ
ncbi:MAG: helix-turn-helix transcriptional regulator [Clostridia bacterium]|nr:helix-turn-helix transcriptional regulator [Clostridia bacterium]